jgi:putative tricarboxylic transport membrane protein
MTRSSRLAVAASLAAFALLVLLLAGQIPSRHVKGDPGPQAFPMATALLIAVGAAYAFSGDARSDTQRTEPWRHALVVAAATVTYILVLSVLGFVVSTALFLIGVSWYLDEQRHVRSLIRLVVGAGIPVILWLVFGRLLGVVLPAGWMGF